MAKRNKGKIIKLKVLLSELCPPKLVNKEFKYISWEELKEEKNGNAK